MSRPGRDLAVGALLVVVVSAASCLLLGVPTSYVAHTVVLYALMALLLLHRMPAAQPGPGIGAANRVTLARSLLVLPVAALTLQPGVLVLERAYWWIIALGTVAMLLDGTDGRVARRTGTASAFGARFDMELDAFLLLALSVLVWQSGKVGSWVILIGALPLLVRRLWPVLGDAPGGAASQRAQEAHLCCGGDRSASVSWTHRPSPSGGGSCSGGAGSARVLVCGGLDVVGFERALAVCESGGRVLS